MKTYLNWRLRCALLFAFLFLAAVMLESALTDVVQQTRGAPSEGGVRSRRDTDKDRGRHIRRDAASIPTAGRRGPNRRDSQSVRRPCRAPRFSSISKSYPQSKNA